MVKMSAVMITSVELLVLLCSSLMVSADAQKCKKVDCGCQFTSGSKTYEISMKGISQKGEPLSNFKGIDGTDASTWKYDLDPCYTFTKSSPCTDVTMCQYNKDITNSFPISKLGIDNYSSFDEKTKVAVVTYYAYSYGPEPKPMRQLFLKLQCGQTESHSKVIATPTGTTAKGATITTYNLTVTSPKLCPKEISSGGGGGGGLSAGSVMVIIFFVVLVIYLVAGILFMKYKRGATGKEVIPNIEFWSSLPGLIKDGCVFFVKEVKELCGRCCQRDGYSEI